MSTPDVITFHKDLQTAEFCDALVPTNLSEFKKFQQFFTDPNPLINFIPFVGPLIASTFGLIDTAINAEVVSAETKSFANNIKYERQKDRRADINVTIELSVLKRPETYDFAFKIRTTYGPPFQEKPEIPDPYLSYFQDQVVFSVKPIAWKGCDTTQMVQIDNRGVFPETNNDSVNYSYSCSWSASGGFEAGGQAGTDSNVSGSVSFSIGLSVENSASCTNQDFKMKQTSDLKTRGILWTAEMKNCYYHNKPGAYDQAKPSTLVVDEFLTKNLRRPPDLATTDFSPQFLATYKGKKSITDSDRLYFKFAASQNLKHAEVVGRRGLKHNREGGVPMVVPASAVCEGILEIDLKSEDAAIIEKDIKFYSLKDIYKLFFPSRSQ